MGIASFVIGILAILLSWVPCLWPIVVFHVLVGLVLGFRGIRFEEKGNDENYGAKPGVEKRELSFALAGIWLNIIAVLLMILWRLFWETDGFGAF